MFKEFNYISDYNYGSGWDRYALDYENLLVPETVYYLTKQVMHHLVDLQIVKFDVNVQDVLDINCGTGNDFPFFFDRDWKVVGCDGSLGMLNRAHANYKSEIDSGRLKLYSGMIEDIDVKTFPEKQFDLIFSITGGFSYVSDEQLIKINQSLSKFLKDGGLLIVAHLNKYCVPDMVFNLTRLRNPFYRVKSKLTVNIKDEEQIMYLRTPKQLKNIYQKTFKETKVYPLLAFTPPYQSGFTPGSKLLSRFSKLELNNVSKHFLSNIADQVVTVCRV